MDVYSFGVLMWELLYEKQPFDGDLSSAIDYVVKEDARPAIQTVEQLDESTTLYAASMRAASMRPSSVRPSVGLHEMDDDALLLTEELANIIRRCW